MLPDSAHGGSKPRSRSPAVVLRRSSAAQAWTDEGHFPRHFDKTWRHVVPRKAEGDAINFLQAWSTQQSTRPPNSYMKKELLIIELSDYEIYSVPEDNFFGELHSLDYLDGNGKKLQFNGVLSIGPEQHYVQGVPVKSYSIEGYGVDDDPNTVIYINTRETSRNRDYDIWYRLGPPCRQYKCFQEAFQWVATLGKHVVDVLDDQQSVGLIDFRQNFSNWLQRRFPNNADLFRWYQAYGSTDFRKIVHAHISYLWSEAVCLQSDNVLMKHPLWDQCGRRDNEMIVPRCTKTVATPRVYDCFKNRYFAGQIMEMQPSDAVRAAREHRLRTLGFPSESRSASSSARPSQSIQQRKNHKFEVGDVISIVPDEEENQKWRKSAKDVTTLHEWFGYVQRITPLADDLQRLYVIWLYRPEDTTISTTDYPVAKELFLSDNCNCQEHKLMSSDVVRRYSVDWFFRGYNTQRDFLVRQKYDTKTSSFVTMKEADFRCTCRSAQSVGTYTEGETVYLCEEGVLEPVVIEENDTAVQQVKVRRLVRLSTVQPEASNGIPQRPIVANELAWTEQLETVSYVRIDGRCYVRFFSREDVAASRVHFPYNQGGAGHFWILSRRLVTTNGQRLEDLTIAPRLLREGPAYTSSDQSKKLIGLSLFSGLGNLDKGLEAGGAVDFHTSIDMNGRAIQTLRANAEDPARLKLWFGSVDDYLHALLSGNTPEPENMKLVAKIGDIGVIAAGSPCPGFSKLQQDWRSEQSLRNAAHVTTFASFVDIYRPEFGFLENVVNMGATRKGFEEELVLSQLVGCLVSLGYQVQQFIMSSWNYGSHQHRNRLIISIAAPGQRPIVPPRPSHSDPEGFKSKSIGRLLNGERFGVRDAQLTPFKHLTPGDALGHLPNIGCGVKHPCIRYPDHVLRLRPNIKERRCIAHIPTYPPGAGLEYAVTHGLIPKYLYENKSEISSKSYRRIKKDGLIGTIVTAPSPHDSRSGPFVHWDQNRCITLEEARIAQDIPVEDVLIGSVNDQYKMVGNAVDRKVSKVLGLELRRAVDQDPCRMAIIRKQSVSVVINVKRQRNSNAPRPTIEGRTVEAPAVPYPSGIDQDIGIDNESDDIRKINELDTSTSSRSVSQGEARQSTETKTSISSRSTSNSAGTLEKVNEHQDGQGPVPKGRQRFLHRRLASGTATAGDSTHEAELDAQLEAESGFDFQAKPGRNVATDNAMVEFDTLETAPTLAMSRTGFLGNLPKTLSAILSFPCSSLVTIPEPTASPLPKDSAAIKSKSRASELPVRIKRSREQDITDCCGRSRSRSRGAHSPSKRVKASLALQRLDDQLLAGSPKVSTSTKDRPEHVEDNDLPRKTRHSGLIVEYAPRSWNKTVEMDIRTKANVLKKPQLRPYA